MVNPADDRLSVIVRTASQDRLTFLNHALSSLASQSWRDLDVILAIQSPSPSFLSAADSLLNTQAWPHNTTTRLLPVNVAPGVDGRAILLNEGLKHATGRYLAFLDDDDIVYLDGYRTLIEVLKSDQQSVLAIGDCRVAFIKNRKGSPVVSSTKDNFFRRASSKFDLLIDNFIPIHSYVLDRSRIDPQVLHFRDEATLFEDYEFLLRLASRYSFNFDRADTPVCEYRIHASNTIRINQPSAAQSPEAKAARRILDDMKKSIVFTISQHEFIALTRQQAAQPKPFLLRQAEAIDHWIKDRPGIHRISSTALIALKTARDCLGIR